MRFAFLLNSKSNDTESEVTNHDILKAIAKLKATLDQHFQKLHAKLDKLGTKVDKMDTKVDALNNKIRAC